MGDLETEMQQAYYDEYKNNIPQVDILFQPHHGRKSGAVPNDLLEALNPKLIIIGNAPSEHIDYGDSRQTITQNAYSTPTESFSVTYPRDPPSLFVPSTDE